MFCLPKTAWPPTSNLPSVAAQTSHSHCRPHHNHITLHRSNIAIHHNHIALHQSRITTHRNDIAAHHSTNINFIAEHRSITNITPPLQTSPQPHHSTSRQHCNTLQPHRNPSQQTSQHIVITSQQHHEHSSKSDRSHVVL